MLQVQVGYLGISPLCHLQTATSKSEDMYYPLTTPSGIMQSIPLAHVCYPLGSTLSGRSFPENNFSYLKTGIEASAILERHVPGNE